MLFNRIIPKKRSLSPSHRNINTAAVQLIDLKRKNFKKEGCLI